MHNSRNKQKNVLEEIRIELLRACPLRCVHCSANSVPLHPLLLPQERVLRLIEEFAAMGGKRVTLTGGEPFIYPGLERILLLCRERRLDIRMFSSGILLQDHQHVTAAPLIKQLVTLMNSIVYSVYSAQPQSHDDITEIPGSFAMTIDSIKMSVDLGIHVELHFVPTQKNYQELPGLVALASLLGISRISILRFVPHGRGKAQAPNLILDAKSHKWLRETLYQLRRDYPHVVLAVGSGYNLLRANQYHPCTAAINQLVVAADGNITPCSAFDVVRTHEEYNNILRHSLQFVWLHSSYLNDVRHALQHSSDCLGCLAQKAAVSGRIDASVADPLATQI